MPINFLKKTLQNVFGTSSEKPNLTQRIEFPSDALARRVVIDIYLPPQYNDQKKARFPLVLFNDGQDAPALDLQKTLDEGWKNKQFPPFVMVGLHCNHERILEYGTAAQTHYKGFGSKAAAYTQFVIGELMPSLQENYRLKNKPEDTVFAGFSLGALAALDIAWNNPDVFGRIGVFSGSLWWRSAPFTPEDPDGNRIMHQQIAQTTLSDAHRNLKIWLEVGTNDETDDRNNNGVIDSIDDTLDLIDELAAKGFKPHESIRYLEIQGGEHNPKTWGKAMPDFLTWIFQ